MSNGKHKYSNVTISNPNALLDPTTNLPKKEHKYANVQTAKKRKLADVVSARVGEFQDFKPQGIDYGAIPGYDQYALRAQNQSWGAQLLGFLNQAVVGEIAGGILEGVGYLPDLIPGVNTNLKEQEEFGNWLSNIGRGLKEWTREATPVYESSPGEFAPGDWSWWFANGVSVASTISLMVPAMGTARMLTLAARLAGLGKVARTTGMGARTARVVGGVGEAASSAVFSRHMESLMEASQAYEENYNKNLKKHGEEGARKIASEAAAKVYNWNWGAMLTDLPQYIMLSRSPLSSLAHTMRTAKAAGKGKKAMALALARSKGHIAFQAGTESIEEGYQFIINEEATHLMDKEYNEKPDSPFSWRMSQYTKDGRMATAMAMGAIGGGIFSYAGPKFKNWLNERRGLPSESDFENERIEEINSRSERAAHLVKRAKEAEIVGDWEQAIHIRKRIAIDLAISAADKGNLAGYIEKLQQLKNAPEAAQEEFFGEKDESTIIDKAIEIAEKIERQYDGLAKQYGRKAAGIILTSKTLSEVLQEERNGKQSELDQQLQNIVSIQMSGLAADKFQELFQINALKRSIKVQEARIKQEGLLSEKGKEKAAENIKKWKEEIKKHEKRLAELEKVEVTKEASADEENALGLALGYAKQYEKLQSEINTIDEVIRLEKLRQQKFQNPKALKQILDEQEKAVRERESEIKKEEELKNRKTKLKAFRNKLRERLEAIRELQFQREKKKSGKERKEKEVKVKKEEPEIKELNKKRKEELDSPMQSTADQKSGAKGQVVSSQFKDEAVEISAHTNADGNHFTTISRKTGKSYHIVEQKQFDTLEEAKEYANDYIKQRKDIYDSYKDKVNAKYDKQIAELKKGKEKKQDKVEVTKELTPQEQIEKTISEVVRHFSFFPPSSEEEIDFTMKTVKVYEKGNLAIILQDGEWQVKATSGKRKGERIMSGARYDSIMLEFIKNGGAQIIAELLLNKQINLSLFDVLDRYFEIIKSRSLVIAKHLQQGGFNLQLVDSQNKDVKDSHKKWFGKKSINDVIKEIAKELSIEVDSKSEAFKALSLEVREYITTHRNMTPLQAYKETVKNLEKEQYLQADAFRVLTKGLELRTAKDPTTIAETIVDAIYNVFRPMITMTEESVEEVFRNEVLGKLAVQKKLLNYITETHGEEIYEAFWKDRAEEEVEQDLEKRIKSIGKKHEDLLAQGFKFTPDTNPGSPNQGGYVKDLDSEQAAEKLLPSLKGIEFYISQVIALTKQNQFVTGHNLLIQGEKGNSVQIQFGPYNTAMNIILHTSSGDMITLPISDNNKAFSLKDTSWKDIKDNEATIADLLNFLERTQKFKPKKLQDPRLEERVAINKKLNEQFNKLDAPRFFHTPQQQEENEKKLTEEFKEELRDLDFEEDEAIWEEKAEYLQRLLPMLYIVTTDSKGLAVIKYWGKNIYKVDRNSIHFQPEPYEVGQMVRINNGNTVLPSIVTKVNEHGKIVEAFPAEVTEERSFSIPEGEVPNVIEGKILKAGESLELKDSQTTTETVVEGEQIVKREEETKEQEKLLKEKEEETVTEEKLEVESEAEKEKLLEDKKEIERLIEENKKLQEEKDREQKENEEKINKVIEENVTEEEIEKIAEENGEEVTEEAKEEILDAVREGLEKEIDKTGKLRTTLQKVVAKIRKILAALILAGTLIIGASAFSMNSDGQITINLTNSIERLLPETQSQWAKRLLDKKGLIDIAEESVLVEDKEIVEKPIEKVSEVAVAEKPKPKRIFNIIGTVKDTYTASDSLLSYRSQWDNSEGFRYIPIPVRGDRERGEMKISGVVGVGHFLLDASAAPGKEYSYQGNDSYLRRAKKNNEWVPAFRANEDGSVTLKYKRANDVDSNDLVVSPLRQMKFSDIEFHKTGTVRGFKSHIREVKKKDGSGTHLLFKTRNAYSRFSGGSVVFIFEDQHGNTVIRDFAGSLNQIEWEGLKIQEQFGLEEGDLILGYHDVGSFSAKPKAKQGVISTKQWDGFNNSPMTGGALLIPIEGNLVPMQEKAPTEEDTETPLPLLLLSSLFPAIRKKLERGETLNDEELAILNAELEKINKKLGKNRIKTMYQGTRGGAVEIREFEYYAATKEEAADYGIVREVEVDTSDFLSVKRNGDVYYALKNSFLLETGKPFDILDNSAEGIRTQHQFFRYLREKGYKGLDMTGFVDNQYVVKFNKEIDLIQNDSQEAVFNTYGKELDKGLAPFIGELVEYEEEGHLYAGFVKSLSKNNSIARIIPINRRYNSISTAREIPVDNITKVTRLTEVLDLGLLQLITTPFRTRIKNANKTPTATEISESAENPKKFALFGDIIPLAENARTIEELERIRQDNIGSPIEKEVNELILLHISRIEEEQLAEEAAAIEKEMLLIEQTNNELKKQLEEEPSIEIEDEGPQQEDLFGPSGLFTLFLLHVGGDPNLSPILTNPLGLAWRSTRNAWSTEEDIYERTKALSDYLEDTNFNVEGHKVRYAFDEDYIRENYPKEVADKVMQGAYTYSDSAMAEKVYGKLTMKDLVDSLPIKVIFIDEEGTPVTVGTQEVFGHVHDTDYPRIIGEKSESLTQKRERLRQFRINILNLISKNEDVRGIIEGQRDGFINQARKTELDENGVERNVPDFSVRNDPRTIVDETPELLINDGVNFIKGLGEKRRKILNPELEYRTVKEKMEGKVFMTVTTANSTKFPLRLFTRKISEEEADLVVALMEDLLRGDVIITSEIKGHPQVKGLTYAQALNFLIYQNSETAGKGTKELYIEFLQKKDNILHISGEEFTYEDIQRGFTDKDIRVEFSKSLQKNKNVNVQMGMINENLFKNLNVDEFTLFGKTYKRSENPTYNDFLFDREVLYTNTVPIEGRIFIQPTTYLTDKLFLGGEEIVTDEAVKPEVPVTTKKQGVDEFFERYPDFVESILDAFKPVTLKAIKPSINLNKEWRGDLESRAVYTPEGVNTMRTSAAKPNEHFGNPFSEAGYAGTIKVASIKEAVKAYKDWLLGVEWNDVQEKQREWILNQINQGKLDNAILLYAGKLAARGQGMHPTALAEVVEELRGKEKSLETKDIGITVDEAKEKYSEYLASIFPESVIVFRGSAEGRTKFTGRAFFTERYMYAAEHAHDKVFGIGEGKGVINAFLINTSEVREVAEMETSLVAHIPESVVLKGTDRGRADESGVVYAASQKDLKALGTEQDLKNFKKFVKEAPTPKIKKREKLDIEGPREKTSKEIDAEITETLTEEEKAIVVEEAGETQWNKKAIKYLKEQAILVENGFDYLVSTKLKAIISKILNIIAAIGLAFSISVATPTATKAEDVKVTIETKTQNLYEEALKKEKLYRHLNEPYFTLRFTNMEEEIEWLAENLPGVDIEIIRDLIRIPKEHGKYALGYFSESMITLSTYQPYTSPGTAYHEAFHAVSMLYLTDKERKQIYKEARERYGLKLTDSQVEEKLAEEFRLYVLADGQIKFPERKRQENVFQRLLRLIKEIFSSPLTIHSLFFAINNRGYAGVNKVTESFEGTLYSSVNDLLEIGFHPEEIEEYVNVLTGIAFDKAKVREVEDIEQLDVDAVLPFIKETYNSLIEKQEKARSLEFEVLLDRFESIIEHWDDFTNLVKQKFLEYNIIQEEEENDYNRDNNVVPKDAFYTSAKATATGNTRLFVANSKRRDTNGNLILSKYLRMPLPVEFDKTWNSLQKKLAGIIDTDFFTSLVKMQEEKAFDKMVEAVRELSTRNGDFLDILHKLEDPEFPEYLKTQFFRAMSKQMLNFSTTFITKVGKGYRYDIGDSNIQSAERQIVKEWHENFKNSGLLITDKLKGIRTIDQKKAQRLFDKLDSIRNSLNTLIKKKQSVPIELKYNILELLKGIGITLDINALENAAVDRPRNQDASRYDDLVTSIGFLYKRKTDMLVEKSSYSLQNIIEGNVLMTDEEGKTISAIIDEEIVRELAQYEAEIRGDAGDTTILSADNNPVWIYNQFNYVSKQLENLKNNLGEIIKLKALPYNRNSTWLTQLENEEKAKNIKVHVFDKLKTRRQSDTGSSYDKISPTDDYADRIARVLDSIAGKEKSTFPMLTMADKSRGYYLGGFEIIDNVLNNTDLRRLDISNHVLDIFIGYFIDEYVAMHRAYKEIETLPKERWVEFYHFKQGESNRADDRDTSKGNAFKSILFPSLNPGTSLAEKYELYDENGRPKEFVEADLVRKLRLPMQQILAKRIIDEIKFAVKLGVIERNKNNSISSDIMKAFYRRGHTSLNAAIIDIIATFTINSLVSNIEQVKIFTGNIAMYKSINDFFKRTPELIATGEDLRIFDKTSDSIMELQGELHYILGKTFTVSVINSVIKASKYKEAYAKIVTEVYDKLNIPIPDELKEKAKKDAIKRLDTYDSMDIADAQSWITLKRLRDIKIMLGEWIPEKHDGAYYRLMAGLNLKADVELFLDPLKGMHYELTVDQATQLGIPRYLKTSEAVLFPALVRGTELQELYDAMMNPENPIDMVSMETAMKVGIQGKIDLFRDKENTDIKSSEELNFEPIILQNFFWKLQQPNPQHRKAKIARRLEGSQIKKNMILNIIPEELYQIGDKQITGRELLARINRMNILESELGKKDIIAKLGIDPETLRIQDEDLFKQSLIADMERQNTAPFIVESLELLAIEASPSRKLIENNLLAMVNKATVRTQMPGDALIQLSSLGFRKPRSWKKDISEKDKTQIIYFNKRSELKPPRYKTNKQGQYLDKKGNVVESVYDAEFLPGDVFLPYSVIEQIPGHENMSGEDLKYLFKKSAPELLEVIGYRIPTQGPSSIDYSRVAGILPKQLGHTIVLFDETTTKTGGDFDVDKFFVMMPSYVMFKDGGPIYVRWNEDTYEEAVLMRYVLKKEEIEDSYVGKIVLNNYLKKKGQELGLPVDAKGRAQAKAELKESLRQIRYLIRILKKQRRSFGADLKKAKNMVKTLGIEIGDFNELLDEQLPQIEQLLEFLTEKNRVIFRKAAELEEQRDNVMGYSHKEKLTTIIDEGYFRMFGNTQDIKKLRKAKGTLIERLRNLKNMHLASIGARKYASIVHGEVKEKIEEQYASISLLTEEAKELTRLAKELAREAHIEAGLLTEYETFKQLPIEEQQSKKAIQNEKLELYKASLKNPRTFIQVINPLDASWLKDDINELFPEDENFEDLEILTPRYMLIQKNDFLLGKTGVGLTANQLVDHAISQSAGVYLQYAKLGRGNLTADGKKTSLAGIWDEDGFFISDNISAFLNGYVDIAKDKYVVRGNHNAETSNVVNLLLRAGVSRYWVNRFISQPILKDLSFQKLIDRGATSPWSKLSSEQKVALKYTGSSKIIQQKYINLKEFTKKDLMKNLRNPDNLYQKRVLSTFLALDSLAQEVVAGVLSSKADTVGAGKTVMETITLDNSRAKVLIDNQLGNFLNKFIGTALGANHENSVGFVKEAFIGQFMALSPKTQEVIQYLSIYADKYPLTDMDLGNTIINEAYAFVASEFEEFDLSRKEIKKMFFGDLSTARKLYRYKELEDSPIRNNSLIKYLFTDIDPKKQTPDWIIAPRTRQKSKSYSQELHNAWLDLLTHNDPNIREFAEELIIYSYLTTGLRPTIYSFYRFIPPRWLAEKGYGDFIQRELKEDSQELFSTMGAFYEDQFYRNNWDNTTFVPDWTDDSSIAAEESDSVSIVLNSSNSIGVDEDGDFVAPNFVIIRGEFLKLMGYRIDSEVVGNINLTASTLKTKVVDVHKAIYQRTYKLGYLSPDGMRIKEYNRNGLDSSMFEENNVPSKPPPNVDEVFRPIEIEYSLEDEQARIVEEVKNVLYGEENEDLGDLFKDKEDCN